MNVNTKSVNEYQLLHLELKTLIRLTLWKLETNAGPLSHLVCKRFGLVLY